MPLTVAIPTIGRPSLARCVFSFLEQLHTGDEVILVADPKGDPEYVRFVHDLGTNRLGVNWQFAIHDDPTSGWGQAQRNRAYELAAPGNYVWWLADDDLATPGALAAIRDRTMIGDDWLVFHVGRGTETPWLPVTRKVEVGNIDADCIVARQGLHAEWGLGYDGDAVFARSLFERYGEPRWSHDVIAVTRPSAEYVGKHYGHRLLADLRMWHELRGYDCAAHSEGLACCIDKYLDGE